MSAPIACLRDDALLDDVLRLAAAAGCALERAADAAALRARWHDAPLVVLDEHAVHACRAIALPRRESVLVVSSAVGRPS